MLTFDSIRIRNFRAIEEITFQPKVDGITGIFGPNGQGKTSILIAVLFALYGTRPKNVSVGSLRRIGSGSAECSVSVVFTHLSQKVEVIRELKGSNDRVIVNIYVEGKAASVTSVGAADKWMQRRFGIDAEGFLTAFVIRQKELDSFVQAVPSERKKIIEKLAGVETINKALQAARDSEKDSRKVVDVLPGSQELVNNAGAEVTIFEGQMENAEHELESVRMQLSELQISRKKYDDKLQELRGQENELFRLGTQINSMQREFTSVNIQLDRVLYVETMDAGETADSLRKKYQDVVSQINALRTSSAEINHSIRTVTQTIAATESRISVLDNQIEEVSGITEPQKKKLIKEQDALQGKLVENAQLINRLESTNNDLAISVDLLKHSAECPTCHTDLKDPAALVEQFRKSVTENEKQVASSQQKIMEEKSRLAEIGTVLAEQEKLISLKTQKAELATNLAEQKTSLQDMESPGDVDEKISTLVSEQETIAEIGRKAKTLEDDRNQFINLTERKSELQTLLDSMQDDASLIELNFNKKLMSDVESALVSSQKKFESLSSRTAELTSASTASSMRFENARSNYKRHFEQWERKRVLMEAHSRHTLTTDMLDKFRQETVSSIAPELSDHATALIGQMTNGDFIEVRLDEDFKASLVDRDGVERQSSWLSGGEESALALSLRLATAFLITGGNSELLWLDEPLTAQDADRRSAILSTIRTLPIKQIIMINHAQEAKDIVDYAVTLGKEK